MRFWIEDNRYYLDGEIILDCTDRIHNYSRVPLHRIEPETPISLPEIIEQNYNVHKRMNVETNQQRYAEYFIIIDALLSSYFVQHGEPLSVAELGCNSGSLSAHIASLLAEFDPDADYACVCDTIGNESGSDWLDRISQVSKPRGLSMIAADFSNTLLRDNYFDYTVINGTISILEPAETIREAVRITAEDGYILLFSDSQSLLDDSFRLFFPKRQEWREGTEITLALAEKKSAWMKGYTYE